MGEIGLLGSVSIEVVISKIFCITSCSSVLMVGVVSTGCDDILLVISTLATAILCTRRAVTSIAAVFSCVA